MTLLNFLTASVEPIWLEFLLIFYNCRMVWASFVTFDETLVLAVLYSFQIVCLYLLLKAKRRFDYGTAVDLFDGDLSCFTAADLIFFKF